MFSSGLARQRWNELMDAIDAAPIVVPCQNTDPELWFPDDSDTLSSTRTRYNTARKLCKVCPVRDLCLSYAMTQPEVDGMWGGLSPDERKQLRRNRR